ncbi:RNA polymerase sigma-70 factor [Mucilaginibacter terrae]|uniref:RNA polymerase sigma-70 factor (Family 1) n=1 Tax=Mucilaginibacter terrae TaxID=1955052 RepID=A0ABU3GR29_9SPHI|nr:RNA polymerase sigma-70 factor [Mucilaginibacter terrae]MDT3402238.1 RNA polymerase sigma-70 factor (family 1) [Mucilaginibacter terrae]
MSGYHLCTEAELIAKLSGDDDAAFTEIYRRFWDKVFAVAFHRLDDQAEAEEVVQDVFFSLWKRRHILDLQYSLNTYLSTAVKYKVINYQSRRYFKGKLIDIEEAAGEVSGVDSTQLWLSERELKQQLDYHIEQLPEKCRLVFKMSREECMSHAEIAQKLEISEKTVEAHITRALKVLKNNLKVEIPIILCLLFK